MKRQRSPRFQNRYPRCLAPGVTIVVVALVAAACSGGSDSAAPAASSTSPPALATPISEWCSVFRTIDSEAVAFQQASAAGGLPARQAMDRYRSLLHEAAAINIAEPKESIDALVAGIRDIQTILDRVDYNAAILDQESVVEYSDVNERIRAPSTQLRQFNSTNCGELTGGQGEIDPALASIRERVIDEYIKRGFAEPDATCVVDSIDLIGISGGSDRDDLVAAFLACGVELETIDDLLSPAE